MKIETYERARNLQYNINSLEKIIKEVDEDRHWIKLITPRHNDEWFSFDFQKSLLEFAKMKLEEYKKEFDELKDIE